MHCLVPAHGQSTQHVALYSSAAQIPSPHTLGAVTHLPPWQTKPAPHAQSPAHVAQSSPVSHVPSPHAGSGAPTWANACNDASSPFHTFMSQSPLTPATLPLSSNCQIAQFFHGSGILGQQFVQ